MAAYLYKILIKLSSLYVCSILFGYSIYYNSLPEKLPDAIFSYPSLGIEEVSFVKTEKKDLPLQPTKLKVMKTEKPASKEKLKMEKSLKIAKMPPTDTQEQRQRLMDDFCKQNGKSLPRRSRHSIYSEKQKIFFCVIPKSACTTWKRIFLAFDEKMTLDEAMALEKEDLHRGQNYSSMNRLKTPERAKMERDYFSFYISRHPFERLVASYRNKFEDPYYTIMLKNYGSRILRMFRKKLSVKEKSGFGVTFNEFVRYIIQTKDKYDPHWGIMSKMCPPCAINYSYIGKMDTLIEDSKQIIKNAGLSDKFHFPENSQDRYAEKSSDIMKRYFANVTKEQQQQLYNIYKNDFIAYGYDVPDFMDW